MQGRNLLPLMFACAVMVPTAAASEPAEANVDTHSYTSAWLGTADAMHQATADFVRDMQSGGSADDYESAINTFATRAAKEAGAYVCFGLGSQHGNGIIPTTSFAPYGAEGNTDDTVIVGTGYEVLVSGNGGLSDRCLGHTVYYVKSGAFLNALEPNVAPSDAAGAIITVA